MLPEDRRIVGCSFLMNIDSCNMYADGVALAHKRWPDPDDPVREKGQRREPARRHARYSQILTRMGGKKPHCGWGDSIHPM